MSKINFNYTFKDLDGKDIPEREDEIKKDKEGKEIVEKSPPFTLKSACVNVLLNSRLEEIICPQCNTKLKKSEELTGEEKLKRFMLATKIYDSKDHIEIGTKDIELLKDLIAKSYPELTSGQAWIVLDPGGAEEKLKD